MSHLDDLLIAHARRVGQLEARLSMLIRTAAHTTDPDIFATAIASAKATLADESWLPAETVAARKAGQS